VEKTYDAVFSEEQRRRAERITLVAAVLGFVAHLTLYFVHRAGVLPIPEGLEELFRNPISAVYTPFTFILVYEVLLLVYYIPLSFTEAVARQFEIISLIVIRRLFKDLAGIRLEVDALADPANVAFIADLLGILVLFGLIVLFKRLAARPSNVPVSDGIRKFVRWKKAISIVLVPTVAIGSVWALGGWLTTVIRLEAGLDTVGQIPDVNQIFFNEFFTLLILVDVLLLLLSLSFTDSYEQLIRNAGFVVSTVLIRLSFSAPGLLNIGLIVMGVAFGLAILALYEWASSNEAEPVGLRPGGGAATG
jgi:hypothetical protein